MMLVNASMYEHLALTVCVIIVVPFNIGTLCHNVDWMAIWCTCRCTEPSSADCKVYCFEMTALSEHLRRQVDQNRNATYFNIDILKYQVTHSSSHLIFVVSLTKLIS